MNEQKTVVIYHRADFDGIFCREIARKFLPNATLIGWDYGDPTPGKDVIDGSETLYVLDLSVPDLMDHPNLIWIDHHKSAIEKYPTSIPGYRIDGVAACRLTWQWFYLHVQRGTSVSCLPTWDEFKERDILEPWAVRLAGEYDIWDKRDPNAELFQHGLRSCEITDEVWSHLVSVDDPLHHSDVVSELLQLGKAVQYSKEQENAGIIKSYGFDVDFEGLKFLVCNHARFNSLLFTAGVRDHHDALLGFNWTGKHWRVSLYHAPGKEHHDLSVIASKYGGGGHRGACGFTCGELPFQIGGAK